MSRRRPLPRILVVGQVPPPTSGQTVMVETLLAGTYEHVDLLHVDAAFSTSVAEMGRNPLRKVGRLVTVLARALVVRARQRPEALYYHPAGSNRSAVIRDIVLLAALRPLFRRTIFHCHALGLPGAVADLPRPLRFVATRVYRHPDLVLGPSEAVIDETAPFFNGRAVVVPNGSAGGTVVPQAPADDRPIRILFLNMVSEAKGASWLVEAVAALRRDGLDVELELAGELLSEAYRHELVRRIAELGLADHARFLGVVLGDDKWAAIAGCDVFCVPTTYPQETFGLAMVEAASCGRPVVATDVPGVRELFVEGESILLADPADRESLTKALATLCRDDERRARMGRSARRAFEDRYTLERFWTTIDDVLASLW